MGRPWEARRVTERDKAAGKALQQLGYLRREDRPRRVARMLRKFMEKNPRMADRPAEAWMAFVGQLLTEQRNGKMVRKASTVLSYAEAASKYGIRPDNLDAAEARLAAAAVAAGLSARKRGELKERKYRQLPSVVYLNGIRDFEGAAIYRTGIYLLLATGSRAEHLCRMNRVRIDSEGVQVLWGARKKREPMSTELLYPFRWSCKPPKELRGWLRAWHEVHHVLTTPDGEEMGKYVAANRINRYTEQRLGRKVRGMTSSYYRRRMSTLLLHEMAVGNLDKEKFGDLMDHTRGTGRARYLLEGDPTGLLIPVNAVLRPE